MTGTEDEPMRVTLRDVYNLVGETRTTVASLDKKFELMSLAALNDSAKVIDHESRIRFLERWAWSIPASCVTAIAAALVAIVK